MLTYLKFWGKAAGELPDQPRSHPLAYHNLDVAAVAAFLLEKNARRLGAIARLLRTTPENARRLLVWLIALHDIGKFTTAFQAKNMEVWPTDLLGAHRATSGGRHDADGYAMRNKLKIQAAFEPALSSWNPSEFNMLWAAVAGHHGRPANQSGDEITIVGLTPPCLTAAAEYSRDIGALFGPLAPIPEPDESQLAAMSWTIAGLAVIADWIGSNRARFAYQPPDCSLPEYWKRARAAAEIAVDAAGILPVRAPDKVSPSRLLPKIPDLSPLQRRVADMPLPEGPILAIIEDVTGSGKTEAALLLAGRLIVAGRADGLFLALPTMATANAMYERLDKGAVYRRLFADGETPSLVLAHGRRALHDGFTASILPTDRSASESQAEAQGDESGAACGAWIADDRRKAFLAHVGCGTIDQAILGVLPTRHQALRLWGLSDRVLVVDEAHAYDSYVSREVEKLIEFHSALGGSAIVLSATLTNVQREALTKAFARGLALKSPPPIDNEAYPLLTIASPTGVSAHPLASRADRARSLKVRRVAGVEAAADHVEAMARRGAAVAWIRNAVDDAIEGAKILRERDLKPVLLHSRFAMGDRLDIEERVRSTLGPQGAADMRRGFVLIGTQILEQSLDYDVDAMITDLAPIDLMIQRAGRLWRHSGRTGRPVVAPELLVLSPDPHVVLDRDWYRTLSPRGAVVYDHHGIVWLSAKTLLEAGRIETPGGVRGLVERVYSHSSIDDIPAPLRAKSNQAEGKRGAARSIAEGNLLDCWKGYGGEATQWSKDTLTPTRLIEPVTLFRLGKIEAGRIAPWRGGDESERDLRRAWALSEISIAQSKATSVPPGDAHREKQIADAKAAWPEWERNMPLLVLEPQEANWRGAVSRVGEADKSVIYRRDIGLWFDAT